MNYQKFVNQKLDKFEPRGFDISDEELNPDSYGDRYQFQPHIVRWALKLGCAAIFAKFGMGKTRMQLEWAKHVARHTHGKVLILAPLAVAKQTAQESKKFGIDSIYVRSQADVDKSNCQVIITNYEMLKNFDASQYQGIVLDESSCLKQYRGKTKLLLCESFKDTSYRLACSATPSPNDWLELGNHSEWLGIMDSHSMISRWFINDTMKAGGYKLRPYGADAFWKWVSSWAVCLTTPSDLGFSDDGWILPKHHKHYHVIPVDHTLAWNEPDRDGQLSLIRTPATNATTIHKEARLNTDILADKIASIVAEHNEEQWAIWCFTDYESEALQSAIHDAVELRGSEKDSVKEEKLMAFANGEIQKLITKPSIAGLGLNWQHCHHQAFQMGTSYSFEQLFQALHRLYRHGQMFPVHTHLVYAETAGSVRQSIDKKQRQYDAMQLALRKIIKESQLEIHQLLKSDNYSPTKNIEIPSWLVNKAA